MKIIVPTTITDANFTSSTVLENDYAAWVAGTSYVVGNRVIRTTTHKIYENLIAGINASLPEDSTGGATPRWLEVDSTNKWSMFDGTVGSDTSSATPLTVVIAAGSIDSVSVIDFVAEQIDITYRDAPGGTVVYHHAETDLDGSVMTDIYDWFVQPYEQIGIFSVTDLPQSYVNGELTVFLSGATTVSCGEMVIGNSVDIGGTQYGSSIGLIDYSRKEVNDFGRVTIVTRSFVKTLNAKVELMNGNLASIYKLLGNIHTTPVVWIGSEVTGFDEPLTVYGFYKDFNIDISYPETSMCTLTIEGLI